MRLTNSKLEKIARYNDVYDTFLRRCYCKLKKLEDIEDICKTIKKQPFYTKTAFTKTISKEDYTKYDSFYSFPKHSIEIYDYENEQRIDSLRMEEYGVTWALKKEELE